MKIVGIGVIWVFIFFSIAAYGASLDSFFGVILYYSGSLMAILSAFHVVKSLPSLMAGGPLEATAKWGADCIFVAAKSDWEQDWDKVRNDRRNIFLSMVNFRPGTDVRVKNAIQNGDLTTLTEVCAAVLLSEAISVNPNDVPEIHTKIRKLLLSKGIPEDIA